MPRIDKELQAKGLLPVLPRHINAAAANRGPGYRDAVEERATKSGDVYYFTREDYEFLQATYPPIREDRPALPLREPTLKSKVDTFLDLEQPCPESGWDFLRGQYRKEVTDLTEEGCTSCQLNSVKRKYREILNTLLE